MKVFEGTNMKRTRVRKRTTLKVIEKVLVARRPFTSSDLADATGLSVSKVGQILKRLVNEGWLIRAQKHANEPALAVGGRPRFRLTTKGAREARSALQKQGTLVGGKWQLNEGGEIPVPTSSRRLPVAATGHRPDRSPYIQDTPGRC